MLKEHCPESDGVDVVEARLHVEEEGGDFPAGLLKGANFMGEGGDGICRTEARERAALVWVEEAGVSDEGHESDGQDPFPDLGDSFQEDDYAKGGQLCGRRTVSRTRVCQVCRGLRRLRA